MLITPPYQSVSHVLAEHLSRQPPYGRFACTVAWARASGVAQIGEELAQFSGSSLAIVGVDFGQTSYEGVLALWHLMDEVFLFSTAASQTFHLKLYAFLPAPDDEHQQAACLVGSCNATYVCDEFPDVVSECPTAASMFKKVGRIGRELRVRLTALSQSASVKTLGISGEGDVRENYTWLYLGKRAVRVMPELTGSSFPGVLDIGGEARAIETHHLPTLARLPLTRARPWEPVQSSPMGQTADDHTVTGQDWSDRSDWSDQGEMGHTGTGQTGISDTQIRHWLAAGMTKNEIARRLGGSKGKAYERINAAMADRPDEGDEPPAAFEFLG